jgi:hypothetical protein
VSSMKMTRWDVGAYAARGRTKNVVLNAMHWVQCIYKNGSSYHRRNRILCNHHSSWRSRWQCGRHHESKMLMTSQAVVFPLVLFLAAPTER